jgi:hypothetical protein
LHTKQAPNQEEEFSAWNLSVDEDAPPNPAPVPPRSAEIRLDVFPAKLPAETPASAAAVPENHAPEIAKAGDGGIPGKASRNTPDPAAGRTVSLPALQQGFIWAEILGTPKGL